MNTIDNLIEQKWTIENMSKKLEQTKSSNTYLFNKYAENRKGQISSNFTVKIERGEGVILKSISAEAEPLFNVRDDIYEFDAKTARFALENVISPSSLNDIESLDYTQKPVALASQIGEVLREHKRSIDATLEYLTAGALFNKVIDGNGKILFELENKATSVSFDNDTKLKTSINSMYRAIRNVLGDPTIMVSALCGSDFIDNLNSKCIDEDLFTQGIAKYENIDGKYILNVYGVGFCEYSLTYKDAKGKDVNFIDPNKAIFIPENSDIIQCTYSRANDINAIGKAPTLYFSAIEPLPRGRGYSIRSESRALVYNTFPEAIITATF